MHDIEGQNCLNGDEPAQCQQIVRKLIKIFALMNDPLCPKDHRELSQRNSKVQLILTRLQKVVPLMTIRECLLFHPLLCDFKVKLVVTPQRFEVVLARCSHRQVVLVDLEWRELMAEQVHENRYYVC